MSGLRRPDVVCVLASTGGPNALTRLLTTFAEAPEVPFVIIQHMPAGFTGRLADRLATVFADFTVEVYDERHHFDPPHRVEPERLATALTSMWART